MRFQRETVELVDTGLEMVCEMDWRDELARALFYIGRFPGFGAQKLFRNYTDRRTLSKTAKRE